MAMMWDMTPLTVLSTLQRDSPDAFQVVTTIFCQWKLERPLGDESDPQSTASKTRAVRLNSWKEMDFANSLEEDTKLQKVTKPS